MRSEQTQQWRFSALDTLFFKESRPMEAVGGAQLQSVFPPPARTLIGAIRTAIGEAHQVDWKAYARDEQHPLKALIGSADSLGPLSFTGPFLTKAGQRLFPVPLALLSGTAAGKAEEEFTRLEPSAVVTVCDLGAVRLPKIKKPLPGAKPLENTWITREGFETFLKGELPAAKTIEKPDGLHHSEERLGIGRDNARRTTVDGLLYQTRHVRPRQDIAIGIHVHGLSSTQVARQGLTRLGAEGRLASWECDAAQVLPKVYIKNKRVVLVLLTHAQFRQGWLPDGFSQVTLPTQQTVWEGVLHGVSLRLISCVVGKPVREGGWDLVNRLPRTMDSLVPAGSCYFCEVLQGNPSELQGRQIGQDTAYGRGEIALGNW